MTDQYPRLGARTLVLIAVGVILMAFLGVLGGNAFMDWQLKRRDAQKLEGLNKGESSRLRTGDTFPDIALVGVDGLSTSTSALNANGKTLHLFLSVGCEPCTEAVQIWSDHINDLPSEIAVVGITKDHPVVARGYAERYQIPFPIYCDTNAVLDSVYDLNIYPTVVGTAQGGRIAFIHHGFDPSFTPEKAVERFEAEQP